MESQILNCIMYIVGLVGVVGAIFWRGQCVGRQKAINSMRKKNDAATDVIKDTENRVKDLSDDDLDRKNMKWVKKKN